ncbi:transmembrane protein 272-like isoform X2 [Pimephales promelas]|uniref:transmembrane protein 272-like isoform X2 n=1 Tax=Pimephales promelas TaxID=90988 RepID=UPI0019559BE7|nr:transmembrane protein 272-like isoform X2 [Pimephales promelas]XP_039514734.1 transmembrane protein 272-like isoform X2 [Pimephales promelas]
MGNSKPSPFLTSLLVILTIVVLGVLIAAIGIGAYFLRDCPVQPHIPVYLIVFGVFVFLVLIVSLGLFYGLLAKDTFELLLLSLLVISVSFILYLFVFCWFIAGSVWIYSVHRPSYDPTHEPNYCNKTLYLFAFWLNTVCYGCLAVLLLCIGFSVFYICVQNTCQRPQSSASNSQQQAHYLYTVFPSTSK